MGEPERRPLVTRTSGRVSSHHDEAFDPTAQDGCRIFGVTIPSPLPHGSIAASAFNLASITLGAGTLAMPKALHNAGYVLGSICIVIVMGITIYALRLLAKISNKTKLMSYEHLSHDLLGKKAERFTEIIMIVFCFGVTVVYVVAIADILDPLRKISGVPSALQGTSGRDLLTSMFWVVFMLPLSLAKEINTLRYASMLAIFCLMFIVIAIVTHAAEHGVASDGIYTAKADKNMLLTLPILMFSFQPQTNMFEIYTEMRHRSIGRMTGASVVSMGICAFVYISAGTAGYMNFGDSVKGNILSNYKPTSDALMGASYMCMAYVIAVSFPICGLPARDAILHALGYHDQYSTPNKVRIPVCVALASASLILGILVPSITVCFGLLGGGCGSFIGYILPATFALKSRVFWPQIPYVSKRNPDGTLIEEGSVPEAEVDAPVKDDHGINVPDATGCAIEPTFSNCPDKLDLVATLAMMAFGIVAGILGTTVSIINTVSKYG